MEKKASITVKLNSLTDRETIDMLKEASMAGVKVRMIIRGICCLLPGVDGYTDNVQVTGVVGRFSGALEGVLLRRGRRYADVHLLRRFHDQKSEQACRSGLPHKKTGPSRLRYGRYCS